MKIGFVEFLILVAAMMSCQALAVDAMLPALPSIASALGVTDGNRMQWVITAYLTGLGVGQLVWGVMSDRFGRRRVLLVGLAGYVLAALLSGYASTFEELLAWRAIHGAVAASAVVARSMVRDLYSGRQMARVMSLTFIVFLMVPMLAPGIGQLILMIGTWRELFILFGVFAGLVWGWVLLRLPETLHPEHRMTLTLSHITGAARRVITERESLCYTLAATVMFGSVLAYVGMVQQIFDIALQRPGLMPGMFALCAGAMALGSYANSRIVGRVGMRLVSQVALLGFIGITLTHMLVVLSGHETLVSFVFLQGLTMMCLGLTVANFGAMAMEPMGAIAGIAASLQGSISTVGGALIGAAIGKFFHSTTLPLAVGSLVCGLVTLGCVLLAERGRLFRPHHAPIADTDPTSLAAAD